MGVAVLISGLSILLVANGVYLLMAYRRAPLWAWSSFFVPPLALIYYSLYWHRSWHLFAMHFVGLVLTVMGLTLVARGSPEHFSSLGLTDVQSALAPASLNRPIDTGVQQFAGHRQVKHYIGRIDGLTGGQLFGEKVHVQQVELIDGVLRFKKGQGLFPQKELAIFLGITEYDVEDRWELNINPTMENPPIIHVSQYHARGGELSTRVYDSGYWLELVLSDRRENQLSGFVRLLLPGENGEDKDFIAGNFEAYTNQLRYHKDEVNRFYDSNDTIEYVASEHLAVRFKKAVKDVVYLDTHYLAHASIPSAETLAQLTLSDGSVHAIPLALFKGERGWTVDTSSTDDLTAAIQLLTEEPPAAGLPENLAIEEDVYQGAQYEQLVGKRIKVTSKRGKIREGRLTGIESSQLVLHRPMDNGFMDIYMPKRQVEQIVVLN